MTSTVSRPKKTQPQKTESRKVKKARKTREAREVREAEEARLAARREAAAALLKPVEAAPIAEPTPPEPVAVKPIRPGRAVLSSGLLSLVAVAALGLVRFLHTSLISHHLDDAVAVGVVTKLIATATIASIALPAGVASAMSKFLPHARGAGNEPLARATYRFLDRIGLIGSVVLGVGVWLVAPLVLDRVDQTSAIFAGVLTFSFSIYSFDKAAMYGFDRVPAYTKLELATAVLAIGTTVALVVTDWRVFLLPLILGYTVFVVVARIMLRRNVRGETAPKSAVNRREVGIFVALASAGSLASTGFMQGTNLLAQYLTVGGVAVGYFGIAVSLLAPMNFLPRALNLALFPAMAHAQGSGDIDAVRRHSDISTRALFVVLAPFFAVAILLSRQILLIYGGATYLDGTTVLQVMLAATYLGVVQVASVNALSSGTLRQVRIPVTSAVCGALVGIGAAWILSRFFDSTGVAFGYLIGVAVIAGGPIVVTWRLHQMRWTAMVIRSLSVVALAGVAAVIIDATRLTTGVTGVATAAGAATVVFAIGIVVLWPELRKLIAVARRRGKSE